MGGIMRLKNKKTGEIRELQEIIHEAFSEHNEKSLMNLEKEWEDYEETKGTYFINTQGDVQFWDSSCSEYPDDWTKEKEIGNYFKTEEEAEKAVEKLKAWKRLKDKGFSIYSWDYEFDMVDKPAQTIILKASAVDSSNTDLDLLFGGEE